jgi:alpha-beta hydrolase superfamily lysophospholipase
MFEPLFARLSDRYHLVAPDHPGFGHSDWPDPKTFAYTFDHYAEIMNHFTDTLRGSVCTGAPGRSCRSDGPFAARLTTITNPS